MTKTIEKEVLLERINEHGLSEDHSYEERTYACGSVELFVEHVVEGQAYSALYQERDFIKDVREDIFQELAGEEDLINVLAECNDLEDLFDYSEPVAIRNERGVIEWL